MNSAQIVSRLFSKLIANTPCPSTKINFLMVEGYNDHFYFRSLFVKFFPLFCPCFHCFALFHLFFYFISYFFSHFFPHSWFDNDYFRSVFTLASLVLFSQVLNFLYISTIVPRDFSFFFFTFILFYYLMVLTDIDDCHNHTCRNGATCVDGVNDYSFSCVFGFTGPNCETGRS